MLRDARVKRLDDEGWLARNDEDDNDDDVITISGSDKGCRYNVIVVNIGDALQLSVECHQNRFSGM